MKLVRPLLTAAAAAVLLLAGAALGLYVSARYAPDRLAGLAERLLAERLGPVRIGSVRPTFDWGPALEVRDVRTLPEADAEQAALRAQRIRVGFDLRRIARSDFRAAHLQASGVRATVVRTADGALHPQAVRRLLATRAEPGPRAPTWPADLQGLLGRLRDAVAGLPAITLDDVAIDWRDRTPGAPLPDAGLGGLALSLQHAPLTSSHSLEASGRLLVGDADRGGFELAVSLPALDEPQATLSLANLDLALAEPWLARWEPARRAELELAGRVAAQLRWLPGAGARGADRLELDLLGLGLRTAARLGAERERQEEALASGRVSAAFTFGPSMVAAGPVTIALGPLQIEGRARLGWPFDDDAPFDFSVHGAPLDVATLREWLRASGQPAALRAAGALAGGRLTEWSLGCTRATRSAWRAALADPVGAWPDGCELELAVADVAARLGEAQPLEGVRGRLVYERDRLTLRDVAGRLGEDPLPGVDLTITGVRAVLAALADGRLPAPVPPLPGWYTLEAWAQGDRQPGAPSRWQRAEIDASRLEHPALLRPISGLRAVLRPVPFGWDAEILDAFWGSARITGRARKSGAPPGRIEVEAVARADAGKPPHDPADPEAWFRGGFHVELTRLGPFRASRATGRVRIEGDRGEIREGDVQLVPRGRLVGEVDVGLERRDHVPASGRLRVEGASVSDLIADLGLDGSVMTGTAHLSGDLSAKLIPRENILRELTGPVTLKLRDGEINKRMNLLLAIAAASDTFNPFRSREVLPYEEIDGALALERGFVRGEAVSLVGPAARLVGNGRVNVIDAPYPVEAVVGVYFFKSLDAVISKVPLVNRLVLGKDDNLVAAWFALTGPWVDPQARVLPQTLLTSGPMGIVTEGVPGFVRSGVETLARLLGAGGTVEAPREAARRPAPPEREARP